MSGSISSPGSGISTLPHTGHSGHTPASCPTPARRRHRTTFTQVSSICLWATILSVGKTLIDTKLFNIPSSLAHENGFKDIYWKMNFHIPPTSFSLHVHSLSSLACELNPKSSWLTFCHCCWLCQYKKKSSAHQILCKVIPLTYIP